MYGVSPGIIMKNLYSIAYSGILLGLLTWLPGSIQAMQQAEALPSASSLQLVKNYTKPVTDFFEQHPRVAYGSAALVSAGALYAGYYWWHKPSQTKPGNSDEHKPSGSDTSKTATSSGSQEANHAKPASSQRDSKHAHTDRTGKDADHAADPAAHDAKQREHIKQCKQELDIAQCEQELADEDEVLDKLFSLAYCASAHQYTSEELENFKKQLQSLSEKTKTCITAMQQLRQPTTDEQHTLSMIHREDREYLSATIEINATLKKRQQQARDAEARAERQRISNAQQQQADIHFAVPADQATYGLHEQVNSQPETPSRSAQALANPFETSSTPVIQAVPTRVSVSSSSSSSGSSSSSAEQVTQRNLQANAETKTGAAINTEDAAQRERFTKALQAARSAEQENEQILQNGYYCFIFNAPSRLSTQDINKFKDIFELILSKYDAAKTALEQLSRKTEEKSHMLAPLNRRCYEYTEEINKLTQELGRRQEAELVERAKKASPDLLYTEPKKFYASSTPEQRDQKIKQLVFMAIRYCVNGDRLAYSLYLPLTTTGAEAKRIFNRIHQLAVDKAQLVINFGDEAVTWLDQQTLQDFSTMPVPGNNRRGYKNILEILQKHGNLVELRST